MSHEELIEEAVQAALDAGVAVNGEHGVAAARVAARHVIAALSPDERLIEALDDDGLSGMWKARAKRAEAAIATLSPDEKLIEALERLEAAGTCVFDGLNARIDAVCDAGGKSVPVFAGIADLSDALNETRELLSTTKAGQ